MRKAVVLVSGGLDSSTVLAMLNKLNYEIYALSFNYAQNHIIEIKKIQKFIKNYNVVEHRIINLDLSAFRSSALINKDMDIPKYSSRNEVKSNIPVTYVPARNTIFLSYALGYAEVVGSSEIFIGAHKSDADNYPDCRLEFLKSYEEMANLATKAGVEGAKITINAPLIKMTKAEVVKTGLELGVDYTNTISCYDPVEENSCGKCLACTIRLEAFKLNNISDPITYV